MQIDAKKFDRIARDVFAPVYPVIAQQIATHTCATQGICLDIGCGGGYLGAALARITELNITFLDQSAEMIAITSKAIVENNLQERSRVLQGDVSAIDLPDKSINLAVSRGSVFFWEDLPQAFEEIYRVLAPCGWAYIGGGFGSKRLKESIEQEMSARNQGNDQFKSRVQRNLGPETRVRFEIALQNAGIESYEIMQNDEIGLWIVIRK